MPLASLGPSYVGVLPDPCDWKKTNIIERSEMEKKVSDKGEDEKHKVGQKKRSCDDDSKQGTYCIFLRFFFILKARRVFRVAMRR